jgi:hypothetical protein
MRAHWHIGGCGNTLQNQSDLIAIQLVPRLLDGQAAAR